MKLDERKIPPWFFRCHNKQQNQIFRTGFVVDGGCRGTVQIHT